jgi:lipid-A-disaccharide synthase-like uncharacterized protein
MWAELLDLVDRIPTGWLVFGMLGQLLFSARFLVQWVASERRRQSIIPVAFWWLSLAGGLSLLAYAVHRRDPVFILGQLPGVVVYSRNLMLIRRRGPGPSVHSSPAAPLP